MFKKRKTLNLALRINLIVVVSFTLAMISGCAETPALNSFTKFFSPSKQDPTKIKRAETPEYTRLSEFLSVPPESFKKGPKGGADLVYIKKGVDFKSYNKLMMEYIEFYFKEDADYQGIQPGEIKELADAFHRAMVEALGGAYTLVGKPGPDVLRFRVALVNLVPIRPDVENMSFVLMSGMDARLRTGSVGKQYFVGEASIEVELLDSQSNEVLAAAIDTKVITKHKFLVDKWEHTGESFKFWAQRLRRFLDRVHSK